MDDKQSNGPPPLPANGPPPIPVRPPPLPEARPLSLSDQPQQVQGFKPVLDMSSERLRQNLKKYNKHTNATCLECGYVGMMGVKKSKKPWYLSWWTIIALFLVTLPFGGFAGITWFFIVLAMGLFQKHVMECPSCESELEETESVF